MGSTASITLLALLAIAVLSIVTVRARQRRQALEAILALGLNAEEVSVIAEDLRRGDQSAALSKIAMAQKQRRETIEAATGIDLSTLTPEVGREISWAAAVRQVFRVLEFDRTGTTIGPNNQVNASRPAAPYGYLLVESPILNQPIRLPIVHRDDFLLAASVFDEPELADFITTEELLVTYAPKKVLKDGRAGHPSHVLHYVVAPAGTLDRYYAKDNDVHMSKPNPEILFGQFVYEGQIKVEMKPEPNL